MELQLDQTRLSLNMLPISTFDDKVQCLWSMDVEARWGMLGHLQCVVKLVQPAVVQRTFIVSVVETVEAVFLVLVDNV